jgi:rRNA maturation RNase YbeY
MRNIQFFTEQVHFTIKNKTKIREWLNHIIRTSDCASTLRQAQRTAGSATGRLTKKGRGKPCPNVVGEINIIFCNDDYLLKLNKQYLGHDTFTDIITFDFVEGKIISGDIFISVDRMKENAKLFHVEQSTEMHRLIVHGVLHLLGYKDDTAKNKKLMMVQEEIALELWSGRFGSAQGPRLSHRLLNLSKHHKKHYNGKYIPIL